MSHFAVMVIGGDVEAQMAPYQENNMGDCPAEYMEFHEMEEEFRAEWNDPENKTEVVVMPDGSHKFTWDEEFKRGDFLDRKTVIPPELDRKTLTAQEQYGTFEEFVKEWHSYESRDEKMGVYGYWENPNAKWDWYQVGGRWSNMLKLKGGTVGVRGEKSLIYPIADKHGFADAALKKDIDYDGMVHEAMDEANARWAKVRAIITTELLEGFKTWEQCRKVHEGDIKKAREVYGAQPAVKAYRDPKNSIQYGFMSKVEDFTMSRARYVADAAANVLVFHSYLKDSVWTENGSMGWWGIVMDEGDAVQWQTKMKAAWDAIPDDTMISVVDCHI